MQALRNTPVVLVIRDGWGQNPHPEQAAYDATRIARTPVADRLRAEWPHTLIKTSGEDVGLPICADGPVMGNSEVGHQNIGAGRIVDQEVMRITRAIRDGRFFLNATLRDAFARARAADAAVHIMGLLSDGLVHSDINHCFAVLDMAKREKFPSTRVFVHAFTDGRDTPPMSGKKYVALLEEHIQRVGIGSIASVIGRFYAMDRDHRWERVKAAFDCLTVAGGRAAKSAMEAVEFYYGRPTEPSRTGDEFIEPTQIAPATDPTFPERSRIRSGDTVIFFNYRGDRPRELTKAFVYDEITWRNIQGGGFDRGARPLGLSFVTMAEYETALPVEVIFGRPELLQNILGEVVSSAGLRQFRCAETEKYPHVTFFFNDYREAPFPGEQRELIPSPKEVSTYDQKPEMSAAGVRDAVLRRLAAPECEPLIVVNFANSDMVGHTGRLDATVKACETVDACVGTIVDATLARGGSLIVFADHGNCEQMWDPKSNCPHTAHTNYDVPLFVVGAAFRNSMLRADGRLADIAPTALAMMGLPQPEAMTGVSLLV
ncbi:MAG: 2,3-bisphosphoglycerate-independent phosphoglycerate mutase [Phycisphaerae bacterium]|nr:2,3-bisphosphoglycerate-independent phosphoglycerate mutase [Phycisphaerae bacterium]